MHWQTTRFQIDLTQPKVMGIVNVTPDSFSDGGRYDQSASALAHCEALVKQGADILDIGAESSRPGAPKLSVDQEWSRLAPVLPQALTLGVPVSVDTCKPEIMQRALDLGVDIINDIHALDSTEAQAVVVSHGHCGVCLMHMVGDPATMQAQAHYNDVTAQVLDYLSQRVRTLRQAGMDTARMVLDPGIGFGKTPAHNLALLREQMQLLSLGLPVLVGWSRKSTLGVVTGKPVEERLAASLAAALIGVSKGARIVRVHDVAETVDALKVWCAVDNSPSPDSNEHNNAAP